MDKLGSLNNAENHVLEKYKLCIHWLGFFWFYYEEVPSGEEIHSEKVLRSLQLLWFCQLKGK